MCGRYSQTHPDADIAERFTLAFSGDQAIRSQPRYNMAPTQPVPVIVRTPAGRIMSFHTWGLVPPWATVNTPRPINARSATVAHNPMFRRAIRQQRCLVPADGFYEWRKQESGKTPMRFTLNNEGLFAFAGIYEYGPATENGQPEASVCILTTRPNALVAPVHDRMPVILRRKLEDLWLNPEVTDPEDLTAAFEPYPVEAMRAYEVGRLVNSPRNDRPECIQPVA